MQLHIYASHIHVSLMTWKLEGDLKKISQIMNKERHGRTQQ